MKITRANVFVMIVGILLQALVGAQQPRGAARAARAPLPGTAYAAPRTPWGDPDLQGDYTNKYEQGTPFERPAEFDGRRLEDVTGDELDELIEERGVQVILNAPFSGDPLGGNFGGAPAFYDQFEARKGSRPWFVVGPSAGTIPALTSEARQRVAARAKARAEARRGRGPSDSWTDHSLFDRCISRGVPGSMMPTNYGNSYTIHQAPGVVAIRYEMIHETRIIPVGAGPHTGARIQQHMGDARGHWEGDTLVVETTNFRDDNVYREADPRTLRLVERFRRTSAKTVEWSVTVNDPGTWTTPWTFTMPLTMSPTERVLEYACHEGNRAMENMLRVARAEERAR